MFADLKQSQLFLNLVDSGQTAFMLPAIAPADYAIGEPTIAVCDYQLLDFTSQHLDTVKRLLHRNESISHFRATAWVLHTK
jgi:hypothetical protein